jgi:hypothetical protein
VRLRRLQIAVGVVGGLGLAVFVLTFAAMLALVVQVRDTERQLCRTVGGLHEVAVIVAHDHHLPPPSPPPSCVP